MNNYTIEEDKLKVLLEYLSQKPYAEVYRFIHMIQNLEAEAEAKDED